ncbi:MAG: helix-turn-helix domain-containing protein [Candidatus Paceibacterota bacterium]
MIDAPIELELRKLGLTEKEVKIYLAGLELGPGSVQKIAQNTKITRPTVYEIIKKLEEKGLFAETKQKAKRFFSAQSPERILSILRTQKREIEEKEREFIRIIASLEERYSKQEGIKTYKGKEGLKALEEIVSFSPTSNITIVSKTKLPKFKKAFQKIKKRLGEIKIREIKKNLDGTIIIFDKVAFLPSKKQEGFLIENKLVISLIKSILL